MKRQNLSVFLAHLLTYGKNRCTVTDVKSKGALEIITPGRFSFYSI